MEMLQPGSTHLMRLTCDCGCSFEIEEKELEITKTDLGFVKMVPCPDCHRTVFEPNSLREAVNETIAKTKDECDFMYHRRFNSWWYKIKHKEGKK